MEQQIKNLAGNMQSFSKEKYRRGELLKEERNLSNEIVRAFFGENTNGKKLLNVCEELTVLNSQYNGVASIPLERFCKACKFLGNEISSLQSGENGEKRALYKLQTLKGTHKILRNVELEFNGHRTELDIIVFTKKSIFIVEVKNTQKNVLIDEFGNLKYYNKEKKCYSVNSHLGNKMLEKEYVLREALKFSDYKNIPIVSLVVFTNEIKVEHRYPYITVCTLNNLTSLILNSSFPNRYVIEEINNMVEAVTKAQTNKEYLIPKELQGIKADFWETVLTIENAKKTSTKKEAWWRKIIKQLKKSMIPVATAISFLLAICFTKNKFI